MYCTRRVRVNQVLIEHHAPSDQGLKINQDSVIKLKLLQLKHNQATMKELQEGS